MTQYVCPHCNSRKESEHEPCFCQHEKVKISMKKDERFGVIYPPIVPFGFIDYDIDTEYYQFL